MASFESALAARLLAVTAVTDLVGTRITPIGSKASDNPTLPYLTYYRIGTTDERTMGGGGVQTAELRIDIWAATQSEVVSIAQAIKGLSGTSLDWFAGASGGLTILHTEKVAEADIPDSDPGIFHRFLDFEMMAQE